MRCSLVSCHVGRMPRLSLEVRPWHMRPACKAFTHIVFGFVHSCIMDAPWFKHTCYHSCMVLRSRVCMPFAFMHCACLFAFMSCMLHPCMHVFCSPAVSYGGQFCSIRAVKKRWHTLNKPPVLPQHGQMTMKSAHWVRSNPFVWSTGRSSCADSWIFNLSRYRFMYIYIYCCHPAEQHVGQTSRRPGDLVRNCDAVGLAIKHVGLRPSLAMMEQSVFQFWSLALPKSKEICSNSAVWSW